MQPAGGKPHVWCHFLVGSGLYENATWRTNLMKSNESSHRHSLNLFKSGQRVFCFGPQSPTDEGSVETISACLCVILFHTHTRLCWWFSQTSQTLALCGLFSTTLFPILSEARLLFRHNVCFSCVSSYLFWFLVYTPSPFSPSPFSPIWSPSSSSPLLWAIPSLLSLCPAALLPYCAAPGLGHCRANDWCVSGGLHRRGVSHSLLSTFTVTKNSTSESLLQQK